MATVKPKADRRVAKNIIKTIKSGGKVNNKQINRLAQIIKTSQFQGTYNQRDKKLALRAAKMLRATSGVPKTGLGPIDNALGAGKKPARDQAIKVLTNVAKKSKPTQVQPRKSGTGHKGLNDVFFPDPKAPKNAKNPLGDKQARKDAVKKNVNNNNKGNKGNQGNKKGNKKGGGARAVGNLGMNPIGYPGLEPFPGVPRKQARVAVNQEVNRMLKDILKQAKTVTRQQNQAISQADLQRDRTLADLAHIFGAGTQRVEEGYGRIDDRLTGAIDNVDVARQAAVGQLQNMAQESRGRASSEMERLGLAEAGSLGRLDQNADWQQQQANNNFNNEAANLRTMQEASNIIGEMLGGMMQGSLASSKGRATNLHQDAVTGIRNASHEALLGLQDSAKDIRTGRVDMINELHRAMEDNAYQRFMEGQQANFNNMMAVNRFNLDVSDLNLGQMWKRAEQIERRKAEQRKLRENQKAQAAQRTYRSINSSLNKILGGLS